jgi:predicted O-linked N-acetylglucosamine transferase (SPINDLY family)/thioredoxin-like negative regulator of GroEL
VRAAKRHRDHRIVALMNPKKPELEQARAAFNRRDYATADRLFRQVLKEKPGHVEVLNLLTIALVGLGRFADAEEFISRAVALYPGSDVSFYNYAMILRQIDKPQPAIEQFGNAIRLNASVPETWVGRGGAYASLQQYARALQDFEEALRLNPNHADALLHKANVLNEVGRFGEALAVFYHALAAKSDVVAANLGQAHALLGLNRHEEALAAYAKVLDLRPNAVLAWVGRGDVLSALGRSGEAFAAYDKALALKPDLAAAWLGRGHTFARLKDADAAFAAYDRALALKPDMAAAWVGRGNVLQESQKFEDALAAFERALSLQPGLPAALLGRGNVLAKLRRGHEALDAYDEALRAQPEFAEALLGRADALQMLVRYDEARTELDRALSLNPGVAEAWRARGLIAIETNRIDEAMSDFDKALSIRPDFPEALSNRVFALEFASGAGFEEQQLARRLWWLRVGAPLAERAPVRHGNVRDPERRLKVGYVSADFRRHSAAYSFRPVLLNHDRNRYEITCYSSSFSKDDMTDEFRRASDRWRDVARMRDEALASQIGADEIDILVDLSGHSQGARLGVFARKPAPVQVTAWGHAAGTGLLSIDYLFSDRVSCPLEVRHLFAEKIFDLPCSISIDSPPAGAQPSALPLLSRGYVTFGVFSRSSKVSEEAIALWSGILDALPGSRIVLKDGGYDVESTRNMVLKEFAGHGIAGERISFLGITPRDAHLAALKDVDISLDPFPMGGGISTWESLQMGVPVVAKLGNGVGSRVAGAIMSAVGLGDWVADTTADYATIARKFAIMPEHLRALREGLPAMLAESAAGNGVKYTRAVEAAYRKMWTDYCRSAPA